jgi:hypothetical protein
MVWSSVYSNEEIKYFMSFQSLPYSTVNFKFLFNQYNSCVFAIPEGAPVMRIIFMILVILLMKQSSEKAILDLDTNPQ